MLCKVIAVWVEARCVVDGQGDQGSGESTGAQNRTPQTSSSKPGWADIRKLRARK
jgi:hypothetical protein